MNMPPVKIILAEDHVLLRELLKENIHKNPDLEVIGAVGDGLELLELLKTTSPDLIILDISMPNLQGIEAAKEIKKLYGKIKILILTMHKTNAHVYRAIAADVDGYVLKENVYEDLILAIKTIMEGNKYISSLISEQVAEIIRSRLGQEESESSEQLSSREIEVLKYLAEGKTSQEIAALLSISLVTVHSHRVNLKKKLHIKRTAELIKYAIEQGYV